ncbi:hypothetical protein BDP27DRAFT_1370949 [Rhodocollybia butyracea]|uniref:Uncharacterized protein n=1 Tax=Rhodocollybia butyracea TaxID=206335 RepID=A0A9P5PD96_9AGAR|nr:hypothetical protein BDP27DRAFT_1370949 [Rhodocollybia butyracea]
MSTTLNPKLDLSKLVFKIEAIKLKLDNPPKSGKISVILQAKKDNTPDEKGGFAKSSRQNVNSEMRWEVNNNIDVQKWRSNLRSPHVLRIEEGLEMKLALQISVIYGFIAVVIKEHHRSKPFSAKSLVSKPLSLKPEVIFDQFIKSGVTGETQEFTLPGSDLTIILSISATFNPPKSLVSKLGKYQAGLDVILQIASALGGLNATAKVVIGAATQTFEVGPFIELI